MKTYVWFVITYFGISYKLCNGILWSYVFKSIIKYFFRCEEYLSLYDLRKHKTILIRLIVYPSLKNWFHILKQMKLLIMKSKAYLQNFFIFSNNIHGIFGFERQWESTVEWVVWASWRCMNTFLCRYRSFIIA